MKFSTDWSGFFEHRTEMVRVLSVFLDLYAIFSHIVFSMAKRWSKLKKLIEDLFAPGLPLQIHCTVIRTTLHNEGSLAEVLGVFTICLGKEVIWNFPRQFVNEETVYADGGNQYSFGVRDLNELLRDYLDTPRGELLKKKFPRDYFGMTNILKAADRRVGVDRLQKHFKDCEQESVVKVLSARLAPHQGST